MNYSDPSLATTEEIVGPWRSIDFNTSIEKKTTTPQKKSPKRKRQTKEGKDPRAVFLHQVLTSTLKPKKNKKFPHTCQYL